MSGLLTGIALGTFGTLMVQSVVAYIRAPRIKVDENGHWHFPMDRLADMVEIPVDRRERFIAELPDTVRHMWALKDSYPLSTLPGAEWVDDGLGEFRPEIENAPKNAGDAFAARPIHGADQ